MEPIKSTHFQENYAFNKVLRGVRWQNPTTIFPDGTLGVLQHAYFSFPHSIPRKTPCVIFFQQYPRKLFNTMKNLHLSSLLYLFYNKKCLKYFTLWLISVLLLELPFAHVIMRSRARLTKIWFFFSAACLKWQHCPLVGEKKIAFWLIPAKKKIPCFPHKWQSIMWILGLRTSDFFQNAQNAIPPPQGKIACFSQNEDFIPQK